MSATLCNQLLTADVPILEEAPVLKAEEFEQFMASVGQQSTVGRQSDDGGEVGKLDSQQGGAEGSLAGKILCECSPLTCHEGELAFTQSLVSTLVSRPMFQLLQNGPRSLLI